MGTESTYSFSSAIKDINVHCVILSTAHAGMTGQRVDLVYNPWGRSFCNKEHIADFFAGLFRLAR